MADSSLVPPPASQAIASDLLGPPFAGWIMQFILYGFSMAKLGDYLSSELYRSDSIKIKAYMWFVIILNTSATFLNAWQTAFHGTDQDRSVASVFISAKTDAVQPLTVGLCGLSVQLYLINRCARLFHKQLWRIAFFIIMTLCALLAFLACIRATQLGFLYAEGASVGTALSFNVVVGIWAWISAAIDCCLTVALCFTLKQRKRESKGNEHLDFLVKRLIKLGLRTAAYTSIFGLLSAVAAVAFPVEDLTRANLIFAFTIPLASLYTLSFQTTLASRASLASDTSSRNSRNKIDFKSVQFNQVRTQQVEDCEPVVADEDKRRDSASLNGVTSDWIKPAWAEESSDVELGLPAPAPVLRSTGGLRNLVSR